MDGETEKVVMGTTGGSGITRSATDKERTKMRERQRRSITTKIFHGLRKHGGYRLSPRADINEVLRELAREAGWVVQPDGTTYRSTPTNASNLCTACGTGIRSGTPTPTSSFMGGAAGDSSTTASPRHVATPDSIMGFDGSTSLYYGNSSSPQDSVNPLATYLYGRLSGGPHPRSTPTGAAGSGGASSAEAAVTLAAFQQQQLYMQEARASNHNTPVGSPRRRA